MIALSSAYRWFSRLAKDWSPWMVGSASRPSSSWCSRTMPSTASNTTPPHPWTHLPADAARRSTTGGTGVLVERLLLVAALGLGVTSLEAGHAAAGVQDLLLARVERVAGRADVRVDRSAGLGASGGERVPAGARHLGLDVRRVDVLLHDVLSCRPPGRPTRWR